MRAWSTTSPAGVSGRPADARRAAGVLPTAIAAVVGICCVFVPVINAVTDYSWFVGYSLGLAVYYVLAKRSGIADAVAAREGEDVVVG